MKYFAIVFALIVFAIYAFSQDSEKVLASAKGLKMTAKDLPVELQSEYLNSPKIIAEKRSILLNDQISTLLLEIDAKARNLSVEKLFENVIFSVVKNPTDEEISSIFELNRAQLGNKSIDEVRPQIIQFLRREPEARAYKEFVLQLKKKHKVIYGKDVSTKDLKKADILVTVGTTLITFYDFSLKNNPKLADFEGDMYDQLKSGLEEALFNRLLTIEADALAVRTDELIAQEITNKLREYSDEERELLEDNLKKRLFSKFDAKIFLDEPVPFVQSISTDNDPYFGGPNAGVTVVVFSDFQCPACAAVHPVLKSVISEFGGKVRVVIRDFPLINIHENAFRAAIAANAANEQGKYFEYSDILYKNQNKLDDNSLKRYALDLGLNIERFELDLKDEKHSDEVKKDMADGNTYGVSGTPTIYVNGLKIRNLSTHNFKAAIEKAIKQ